MKFTPLSRTNLATVLGLFLSLFFGNLEAKENPQDPNILVAEMQTEIQTVLNLHSYKMYHYQQEIKNINTQLLTSTSEKTQLQLLIRKDQLRELLIAEKADAADDVSKIRYLKGLQIIKILYEKVLGLDHHFSSVKTFSEISKISNPNQYPEFEKVKELVKNKKDKKSGFDLNAILGSNPLVSVVNTFTGMLVSNLTKEEKDSELQKVDCIIDFTLRMQNDLNTIYFETAFLQKSNETIKSDLESLFKDYTKPIGYEKSMKE